MKKKKVAILSAGLLTIMMATVSLGVAHAASSTSSSTSLIDRLVAKFNLKKSDLQQVFTDYKTDQQAVRQQKLEDRLAQAVTDGKITADQKTKILVKLKELETTREANREKLQTMTPTERKAAMEKERTDLEAWAKDNSIPIEYLRPVFGGPRGAMMHGMMDNNMPPTDDSTAPVN